VTSFSIVPESTGFWIERLLRHNVRYQGPTRRGQSGESAIAFKDPDGLMLELVAHPAASTRVHAPWDGAGIPREHTIRGFHGVTLWVEQGDASGRILTETLGFREHSEQETTRRYVAGDGAPGRIVDVRSIGGFGRGEDGVGAVHHVAFAVADDAAQVGLRDDVVAAGLHPTPVIDRQYFRSVYFREPGGVLYELATLAPGFAVDESFADLGSSLKLPAQHERDRALLRLTLPPIQLPTRIDR
jgi:glyoxalase family protein